MEPMLVQLNYLLNVELSKMIVALYSCNAIIDPVYDFHILKVKTPKIIHLIYFSLFDFTKTFIKSCLINN